MMNSAVVSQSRSNAHPDAAAVQRQIASRSFCTMATVSQTGIPHATGVIYAYVDGVFYVSTLRTSRKARNLAESGRASLCIPVRRVPAGPPSTVQVATRGEILDQDDPRIVSLVGRGALKSITGHGELEIVNGCFLRLTPSRRVLTYGLGLPLRTLIRDPLNASGRVELPLAS
jgi:hypothetical protein